MDGALSEPPMCRPTDSGWLSWSGGTANGTVDHVGPMARVSGRWHQASTSKERRGRARQRGRRTAEIVTVGRDAKGPALFTIAVDTGVPVRLIEGKWINPLWSPDGDLILRRPLRDRPGRAPRRPPRWQRPSTCRRC